MIDPRGHRFGAGISAGLLAMGWWTDSPWLVVIVAATLAAGALFGLRYSVYGWTWRRLARAASWPADELEPEYAPRFAQTIGSLALVVGIALFVVGQVALGWATVLAVVGLQSLLAVTGFCLGCRLYFLNWWLPALATRWWQSERAR